MFNSNGFQPKECRPGENYKAKNQSSLMLSRRSRPIPNQQLEIAEISPIRPIRPISKSAIRNPQSAIESRLAIPAFSF
jgi:hypothetical protein